MDKMYKAYAAASGAALSALTGMPPIMGVLLGVMTLDYVTGLLTGILGVSTKTAGGGLASRAAFEGLMRKVMVLLVVLLAALLDLAVQSGAGVEFSAVSGATCLWFIASEGVSVLENAAEIGLPVPGVLTRALESMKQKE